MSKIICPYCFEKFNQSEKQFRCVNKNSGECTREGDKEYSRYWRKLNVEAMPRVIKPDVSFYKQIQNKLRFGKKSEVLCPTCMTATKTICPFCHNELPFSIGQNREYIIALIGAKQAGKSHYIAILINQFKGIVGHNFGCDLQWKTEETKDRYNKEFLEPLFEKKEIIQGTISAEAERKHPLIYEINRQKRSITGLMVFFDTAGEDLDNIDTMRTEINYITNSSGIILLLDPLQIPAVRDRLSKDSILPEEQTNPVDIVIRVINLIRERNNLPKRQLINIPIALAFSKIDALRSILPPDSSLNRASTHDGKFDIDDSELVSSEIQAYLHEWIGPELNNLVENNFKHFSYFGLSALGSNPDVNGKLIEEISPFRTEDPFLWLLWKNKIIKGQTNTQ